MQDLEEIKNKIRLVDYIQSTGAKIKKLGGDTYGVNPCPLCRTQRQFSHLWQNKLFSLF